MIRAVFFDIDGTLLDSFEANLKFYQVLMKRFGYPAPTREEFPKFFHLGMLDAIQALTKSDSQEEIKKIFNEGQSRYTYYDTNLLKTPEGIEEVIQTLHREYVLGIVTSRIRQNVYEAPQLAKLKDNFEIVVGWEDTPNHKPHPDPLLIAAKRAGVSVNEAVYVGDAETDAASARAAGMKIVIYSKSKMENVDAITSDFKRIPDLIRVLS